MLHPLRVITRLDRVIQVFRYGFVFYPDALVKPEHDHKELGIFNKKDVSYSRCMPAFVANKRKNPRKSGDFH